MEPILKIENLSGGYHKEPVIKDISLDINKGDFLGIIGPNGSGKTTLLRLASRILRPQKGNIYLEGKDIFSFELKEFCRRTAFVAQDMPINFPFKAIDVVLMGRIPHLRRLELETKRDLEIARKALAMTDALGLEEKRIDEISLGEKQRVTIAKALAQEPVILFLDEPTSHLDIGHQIQTLNLLRKLNQQSKITIIIVLHDLNLASEYCNRIALLEKGMIFKEGSPSQVLTYQNIETVYKTVVIVKVNPISSRPYIILASGGNECRQN